MVWRELDRTDVAPMAEEAGLAGWHAPERAHDRLLALHRVSMLVAGERPAGGVVRRVRPGAGPAGGGAGAGSGWGGGTPGRSMVGTPIGTSSVPSRPLASTRRRCRLSLRPAK